MVLDKYESSIFEDFYTKIDEPRLVIITFLVCVVLLFILVLSFLAGLCVSCWSTKPQRKTNYAPASYFRNSLCKSIEDSIYLSEVSPSSDSLPGSSKCSRANSRTTSISEGSTNNLWFPLNIMKASPKMMDDNKTMIHLYLKYVPSNEETNQHGKLHFSIKNIISLPTKDYPRYTEAYLTVRLVRVQRGFKGRTETLIYENRTRNFRNTRDIEVDEHFVADAKQNDLKNLNMVIVAYDQDIYTKPSELASAAIALSTKYKELCIRKQGVEMSALLKHVPKNVGNLLVGLSYLPTSQRLSVNIVRVANISQTKEINRKLYAQLFLLTGVTGRSLKRKKLIFNTSDDDPNELNGNISFDITPNLLENITLLIILYKKTKETNSSEYALETIDNETKTSQDHCYGSVAIGKLVSNSKGKKHWRMMVMAPRRVVTVWHALK